MAGPRAGAKSNVKSMNAPARVVSSAPSRPQSVRATPARQSSAPTKWNTSSNAYSSRASTGSSSGGGGGGYSSRSSGGSGNTGYSGGGGTSYSGGGGSGYGGGGGAVDIASFAATPPPAPIEVPDPMADATFVKQEAELARALTDFQAQQGLAKGQYDNQYAQGLRRLGWDTAEGALSGFAKGVLGKGGGWSRAIPGAYGQAYNSNENDFAGRGLFNSGLYTKSVSDLNDDFTDRKTTMDTAKTDWQATQDLTANNFKSSQESTRQSALTDAIARIAAQYGVNLSDVTPGKANSVLK